MNFALDGFQLNAPKQYYFTPIKLQNAVNKTLLKSNECYVTLENKTKQKSKKPRPVKKTLTAIFLIKR